MSKAEQIKELYRTILKREYDQEGFDYWMSVPITIEQIKGHFLESEEYKSLKA
ncbi:DUF4214 domain-containing protein [bacterium]|nr:DUF4214 domain-containing protein [bacterium]